MSHEHHRGKAIEDDAAIHADAPAPGATLDRGVAVFPKVVMTGRYGAFCSQFQEKTFQNLTPAQIDKYKWNYFGVCGATVTCYDSNGNVISSG